MQEELIKGQEISNYLYQEEHSFKKDIELLYDKISSMNNQLFESSTCVLKNLMKKVKETNQTDKAEYYKIQK